MSRWPQPVYRDEVLLGYLMRTSDIAPIPAYSGEPITLLVGLDLEGQITGLKITEHSEPILVVGISDQDLEHYVEQYRGVTVDKKVKLGGSERDGYVTIDGISGATITAMVMNATVMKSVQKVAATRGIPPQAAGHWNGRRHRAGRCSTFSHHQSGGWASPPSPSGSRCGVIGSGRSRYCWLRW